MIVFYRFVAIVDWIRNKNEDEDYAAMLSEEEFSEPKLCKWS